MDKDIEYVLTRLREHHKHFGHCVFKEAITTITDLQARVATAERDRDTAVDHLNDMCLWAGKVRMEAQDYAERTKTDLTTIRADLAAHKAAVGAVWGRRRWGAAYVTEPLRALAEPAKHGEGDALVSMFEMAFFSPPSGPVVWDDDKIAAVKERAKLLADAVRGLSVKGEG